MLLFLGIWWAIGLIALSATLKDVNQKMGHITLKDCSKVDCLGLKNRKPIFSKSDKFTMFLFSFTGPLFYLICIENIRK